MFQARGHAKVRLTTKAPVPALALALAGLAALAGCGSSSSGTTSSGTSATTAPSTQTTSTSGASGAASAPAAASQSLSLAANPEGQLKYDKSSLTAKAGKVSINFTNSASLTHNVTIESSAGAIVGATPTFQGGSRTLTLALKPGTYKFFCSVPGHRMAGMEGTLTVQ